MNPNDPNDPQDPHNPDRCESDETPAPEGPQPAIERDLLGHAPPTGKRTWDHRRAEPRMLALLWTTYLFIATLLMFASAGLLGFVTPDSYRPSAKVLLLLIFVGATVLYPMLRLTQQAPGERVKAACLKDAMVIIAPAQAIIWPQMFLAHWPLDVLAYVSISMGGWVLICAALLARPLADPGASRLCWMFLFLVIGGAAPVLILVQASVVGGLPQTDGVRWIWMGSPWTAPFELTRDRLWTGSAAVVLPGHRVAAWGTLAVGLAGWFIPNPSPKETAREND